LVGFLYPLLKSNPDLNPLKPNQMKELNTELELTTELELETELVDYYNAFEVLLDVAREYGVYKTHFGIFDHPLDNEYCWFKFITRPDLFPKYIRYVRSAFLRFHLELFYSDKNYFLEYKKVLDVGFGTGGTMSQLANEWTEVEIHGINMNKVQFDIAKEKCMHDKNVFLHLGNFLTYEFEQKFELIYFIESAFHIRNKNILTEKISRICTDQGDIYITDIVYSEQFVKKAKLNSMNKSIFEYLGLNDWIDLFKMQGIEFIEFKDLSEKVANVITITTPPDKFQMEYVQPITEYMDNKDIYNSRIMDAFHSYSKLQRLLKLGILKYGIMRFRKTNKWV